MGALDCLHDVTTYLYYALCFMLVEHSVRHEPMYMCIYISHDNSQPLANNDLNMAVEIVKGPPAAAIILLLLLLLVPSPSVLLSHVGYYCYCRYC